MSAQWISYFGYGSLVNRNTRPEGEEAINATLKGWQRVWNHRVTKTDARHACTSLSIEPADTCISGVLVRIPQAKLADLDKREFGYERLTLSIADFDVPDGLDVDEIQVYRSLEPNRHLSDSAHPVAQSYVDVVMAGYLTRFGDDGLQQLLASTRGWDRPMVDDRADPIYPRSVELQAAQHHYFDSLLTPLRLFN